MKLFDYLYFRTYVAYLKRNEITPWIQSTSLVALMQNLNLFIFYIFCNTFFSIHFNEKAYFVLLFLLLCILNFYRYQKIKPYSELCKLWDKETKETKKIKGYLIILYITTSVSLPILYGYFFHNLSK